MIKASLNTMPKKLASTLEKGGTNLSSSLDHTPVGTSDYEKLKNLPQINGVEVKGKKKGKDYKVVDNEDFLTNEEILQILNL